MLFRTLTIHFINVDRNGMFLDYFLRFVSIAMYEVWWWSEFKCTCISLIKTHHILGINLNTHIPNVIFNPMSLITIWSRFCISWDTGAETRVIESTDSIHKESIHKKKLLANNKRIFTLKFQCIARASEKKPFVKRFLWYPLACADVKSLFFIVLWCWR